MSSVSCIYGIGNPDDFNSNVIRIRKGEQVGRKAFLNALVNSLYARTEGEFTRGKFRVKGDSVDIFPAYMDIAYRLVFFGNELETIESFDPGTGTGCRGG